MPILDAAPFPWTSPQAQELHITLCQLYPTAKGALFIADKIGQPSYQLNGDQSPFFVWKDLLDMAANARLLRALVRQVRDQNPNNIVRKRLDDLLADRPLIVSEPRAADGTPVFIAADDSIGENEALLFHDDLTLSTGRIPWLIAILGKLQALGAAVCRLRCKFGDSPAGGTGFRIAPDLLLTNWHVLVDSNTSKQATQVTAEFGYEEDAEGEEQHGVSVLCDVGSIVTDRADDWGVVRVALPLPATIPILALSESANAVEDTPAFVIQHPQGLPRRVGFVRNTITMCNDRVFHYLTDTQPGSSGAPVFDRDGRLIGLHHVGGRPQDVAGKLPLKKNEGIRIQRVIVGLAAAGIQIP